MNSYNSASEKLPRTPRWDREKKDLDDQAAALTLSFPRLKVFYMRGSEEIELARDERVVMGLRCRFSVESLPVREPTGWASG